MDTMRLISHEPDFTGVFPDKRLDKRASKITSLLAASRSSSIKGSTLNEAEQKGFYRFLENEDVKEKQLVLEMQRRCARNVNGYHVLAISDTTSIGLSEKRNRLKPSSGVGLVGNKEGLGFLVHASLVLHADYRTMLGYSAIKLWHRTEDKANNTTRIYKKQPIEEKESFKWIESSLETKRVFAAAKLITIIEDREGDIYEQFCLIPDGKTHLIVRNRDNRCLANGEKLHDRLARTPVSGKYEIYVTGDPRKNNLSRKAKIAVKYSPVTILRPSDVRTDLPKQITLYAVEAEEIKGPKDGSIMWRLLTTYKVESFNDALNIIGMYKKRWYIEQVFRLLKKQGVRIESSELGTGWAIRKLTLLWMNNILRIMQLYLAFGNEEAQAVKEVFSESEIQCLRDIGRSLNITNRYRLAKLSWASDIIARIGGWKGDPKQRPPGPITMKRGYEKFEAMYNGWCIAKDVSTP